MHTSLIMVALLAPGELPEARITQTLKWQNDYTTARQMGRQQKKPLAVFIGAGQAGWKKVAEEGDLSAKTKRLLAENYVCLYVDRTQPRGEKLAANFEVPSGTGLVVSSRDGESQAFFHAGQLTASALEERLARYSGSVAVTRTDRLVEPRISYVYDPTPSRGYSPPAMQPSFTPSFGGASFGGYSGGYSGGSFGGGSSGGAGC